MDSVVSRDTQIQLSEYMLEFVRASIFDNTPKISGDVSIDWDELMDLSAEQGLLAWVWDGICKLPQEQQPSRIQRINWGLSVQDVVERFHLQSQVLEEMVNLCNLHAIRMLLFKGIDLSNVYPKPHLRPAGDLDIFLFDDYERGNKLFAEGIINEKEKHSSFTFHGVQVENHSTFFMREGLLVNRIESFLREHLGSLVLSGKGYYTMKPDIYLVYLVTHAVRHLRFSKGLTIRSVIDIVMFIRAHRAELVSTDFLCLMDKLNLSRSYELLLSLGERFLQVRIEDYHTDYDLPRRDLDAAYRMFTGVDTFNDYYADDSYIKYVKNRFRQHKDELWKYRYTLSSIFEIVRMESSYTFQTIKNSKENNSLRDSCRVV